MVVKSLTRKEAGEIYNEIREVHENDFYWYVEALTEIFERHGWVKQPLTIPDKDD
jgi:hypothetical protein